MGGADLIPSSEDDEKLKAKDDYNHILVASQ